MIRKVTTEDAAALAGIYNYYLENTTITFDTDPLSSEEMEAKINDISANYPFLVCEEDGALKGYCYVTLWKKKCAYHTTVESTVYVHKDHLGKGIGTTLMKALLEELKHTDIHAIIACITVPNDESVRMHEKLGFRQVSAFREVGFKFGRWLDIGDWELVLNPVSVN